MGSNADSDVTGMTLQALAPYYHKAGYENVTAAIDRGLARLSEMQNDSGGYSTMESKQRNPVHRSLLLCAVWALIRKQIPVL